MLVMRKLALVAALATAVGCAGRETEVRGPSDAQATLVVTPQGGRIPAGTTVWLQLDQKISADDNRIGDRFTAHVTQDVVSPDGELLIPAGAVVHGRVTELEESDRSGDPAVVRLALESIEMHGLREDLNATIVQTEVRHARRRGISGRTVAIGAALGAVVGGVAEGLKGAVIGGALGAGAGTAISLGTGDVEPELPRGTAIAMRLEQPVRTLASLRARRVY